MSLYRLDDPVLVGNIACERVTIGTIRGEIMSRHGRATWNCSAFDAIDAYTDLLDAIWKAAKD